MSILIDVLNLRLILNMASQVIQRELHILNIGKNIFPTMVYMKRGKYLERLPCCTPEEQAAGSVSCFHFHLCNHTLQRFLLRSLLKKKRRIKLTNNYQMSSYHITTFAAVRYSSNCGQNLFSFFLFFLYWMNLFTNTYSEPDGS